MISNARGNPSSKLGAIRAAKKIQTERMSIDYRSSEVKFGDWISEGFRMFVEQWQVWVLQTLVLCGIILAFVAAFFGALMGVALVTGATQEPSALPLFVIFLPGFLIMWAASGALVSGMFKTAFKQLQGGKIQVSDIFSGMDCMPAVLLATFCNGILVMFGLLLCIIPGFIVAGLLYFTIPLIVHRRLGVFEAMGESKELVQKNLLMFILFQFVVQLIAQSGQYICYVGLLATFPLQFTIGVIAYRDCFGVPGARSFQPAPVNPASYSGSPGWRPDPPEHRPPEHRPPGQGSPVSPAGPHWPPSAVAPEAPMCASCGTVLPPGARFCPACGGPA
ncbi:MAG TPA: zinc-ribbon domain-containing protein [Blastocatellia bacterium]|nr:zinc-ribbon domain-containing protein [Blastocatellia bacterium]